MAKKIVDETLKFSIIINGDSAKKEYGQLERQNRNLLNTNKELEAQAAKLKKAGKDQTDEYKKLTAEIQSNTTAIKTNDDSMQKLTKEIGINNLTMRQLRTEAGRLNGVMSNLNPNSQEWADYNKQLQAVKARQANLREEMKATEQSMEDQEKIIGQLSIGFSQLFTGLKSGNFLEVSEGFRTIKGGIQGATKAGLAFIATPIGAAIAALVAIGSVAKMWFNYNDSVKDSIILTQQITKLTGEQADAVRLRNKALSDTFNTDQKETLEVARNLVQQFGISYAEAFDTIEDGLIKGQSNNAEYLDSLREYPSFFAAAGYSVQEFKDIVAAGYDLGIYSDKLPDAIKEFDISIREQTKSTRDALVNAFGAPFTDDILNRVNTGAITTKQALNEISVESKKLGLTQQQNAQLTADLFRGAGEDAGGAVKVFEAVNKAATDATRALTPLEQSLTDMSDAHKELAEAQDEALKSENYVSFARELDIFWTKTKTLFYNSISSIIDYWTNMYDFYTSSFTSIVATAQALPDILTKGLKNVANNVLNVVKSLGGLGDVFERLVHLDFSGAKEAAVNFKNNFTNAFDGVKTSAKDIVNEIAKVQQEAYALSKQNLSERRESNVAATNLEATAERDAVKTLEDEKLAQKKADLFKKSEEELTKIIIAERDKRAIASLVGIEKEKAEIDQKYAANLEKFKAQAEKVKELEALRDEEKAALEIQRKQELADKLQLMEEENWVAQEALRLEREAAAAVTDEEKQRLLIERAQLIAQQELDVEQWKAEEKLRINGASEEEISALKAKHLLQQQGLELNFSQAKKALKKDEVAWTKKTEKQKLDLIVGALGNAASAFNEGSAAWKAIKIAETTITTYQSAVASYNSLANIPVVGPVLGGAAAGLAVATGLASVQKIASTPIAKVPEPKTQGFESGLYPITRKQDGKRYQAKYSANTSTQIVNDPTVLVGERPEMIIDPDTYRKMDPKVTDYILNLAGKPVAGFETGLYPATSSPSDTEPPETSTSSNNQVMAMLASAVNRLVSEGVQAHMNYGIEQEIKRQEVQDKLQQTIDSSKN